MAENNGKQSKRVYVIIDRETKKAAALINCGNSAQADRHFMSRKYETRYAEQRDVFAAAKDGIEIEDVAADSNGNGK